jgi:outer membrane receptor protein involved in Fe transport
VNGAEGGLKALLFDRQLSLTASAYTYRYDGVQVAFSNSTTHEVQVAPTANIRTKGIEFSADYRPKRIDGLTLSTSLIQNSAIYTSFPTAPCYGGETVATGCIGGVHDLASQRVNNAPQWAGRFGLDYRTKVVGDYVWDLSVNSNFSGGYNFTPELNPIAIQNAYITFDAAVRAGPSNRSWEIALIGRNLTNKYIVQVGQDVGTVTPGVVGDVYGVAARPLQVLLQLTVRPNSWF